MDFKKQATMLFNTLQYCSVADSIKDIEKSLRDVQRETAEECVNLIRQESPLRLPDVALYSIRAIRERFGLKEKP